MPLKEAGRGKELGEGQGARGKEQGARGKGRGEEGGDTNVKRG